MVVVMVTVAILIVLLLLAFVPALLMIVRGYKMDLIEKEPIWLLVKLFIGGILTGVLILLFDLSNGLYHLWLRFFYDNDIWLSNQALVAVEYLGSVAVVEEGIKYIFLLLIAWKSKAYDHIFDGILYGLCVGSGFAFCENFVYYLRGLLDNGFDLTLIMGRIFYSSFLHAFCGILMGLILSYAKRYAVKKMRFKTVFMLMVSLVIPILIHGIYDTLAMLAADSLLSYFGLIFVLFAVVNGFLYFLPFQSKRDKKIEE